MTIWTGINNPCPFFAFCGIIDTMEVLDRDDGDFSQGIARKERRNDTDASLF